jgi:phospholipid transport system substrate-binding protein
MVPHHYARVATFALVISLALPVRAESPAATVLIDRFHATLLEVMKNAEALGLDGRLARLQPVMDQTYDFPSMARRSLGPAWGKLDDVQHERFEQVFRGMILRTYATRFNGYTSERFETKAAEPSIAGTEIVRSILYTPKEDIHLDYRVRETPAGWRVIDVYLGGTVSELAMKRAEYTSVLERDGFDALVTALELKVADGSAITPDSSDSRLKK